MTRVYYSQCLNSASFERLLRAARKCGFELVHFNGYTSFETKGEDGDILPAVAQNREALRMVTVCAKLDNPGWYKSLDLSDACSPEAERAAKLAHSQQLDLMAVTDGK